MNDNLPPMPGHPEPHTMVWSRLERETIEAYGKACWDAAIEHQSAAPQPQPVPPEGPMAETVEQAARDVAKCLNERDGQGLDLRHVAMLVHYAQQPVQEPLAWQSIESMAAERYKVVLSHQSMFYRYAVVAGNGAQQLYIGRETECANMARKFAGAFLDGAHVVRYLNNTSPQAQPARPLPVQPTANSGDAEKAELDRMAKYVSTITQSEIDEADSDRGITSPQAQAAHGITKGTT